MTIDGIDVSFKSTRPNWQDIIVSGSEYDGVTDPLRHGDVININNVPIVFQKFTTNKVLKGQPSYDGTPNTQTPAIYLSFGAGGGSADVTNSDPFVINELNLLGFNSSGRKISLPYTQSSVTIYRIKKR